ncbi:hypothetical protein LSCM1_03217 [Leishmania martiniquensis]|uniref:J domain-containing protein n=1 Tax=Leishmania martiniquensis TaxID=1580590 RepID=A0A836GYT2_9TRYP|nr:hypothetical protein LSCM1_03217 [Leishmania martiniquensis]
MRPSAPDSSYGVPSPVPLAASAALRDPEGATDMEIAECVLLIWRDVLAAAAPRHAPTHPAVMHRAALHIFGRDSLQSAASLRRRYRQLAIRVHPDKNTSIQASAAFQVLHSCFEHAISSHEAGGSRGIHAGEPAAFQRAADPSMPPRAGANGRGAMASGEADESHFSPSSSSAFTSSSTSPQTPPFSPAFSAGSSSSSGQPSPTHPAAAAAAAPTDGRPPPPFSGRPTPGAASGNGGVFLSEVVPEPPNVFAASGGEAPAAAMPAPSVFDEDSSDPAAPPSPVFATQQASQRYSAGSAVHRASSQTSTGCGASFAGAASDLGPAPLLVFENVPSASGEPCSGDVLARRAEAAGRRSSQQQWSVRVPERPTLAELLAQLDVDDDDDDNEDSPESAAVGARGPFSQDGLDGSAARGCRFHENAGATSSGLPTRLWPSTTHPHASHSRRRADEGDARECSGTSETRCAATTTVPIHPGSSASSCPPILDAFCSALQEEVNGAKHRHISSASPALPFTSCTLVGSTVRSRRAGGSVRGGSGRPTRERGSGGSKREWCACGKAPRGRCFLCEE